MTRKEIYDSIKNNLAELRKFFAEMPKGGDLHNHLTGSAYAETYFEVACENNMYATKKRGKLYKNDTIPPKPYIQLSEDMDDLHKVRMTLIDKWSIRNFQPYKCALGPDEYFFGEFGLFSAATDKENLKRYAHELKLRAKEENILYLEIMGTSPSVPSTAYLEKDEYDSKTKELKNLCVHYNKTDDAEGKIRKIIEEIITKWEGFEDIQSAVTTYINDITEIDNGFTDEKGNEKDSPFDTTSYHKDDVLVRYQGYASRTKDPILVLAQLYIVHKAMLESDLIVGCNIVAAENSENSMIYYKAHMIMFDCLRKKLWEDRQIDTDSSVISIPNGINTSLHAGELTIGLIRPEHLTYHIGDALLMGRANRIGHGVDMPFEHNKEYLLNYMASQKIPVEINLISNEFILGAQNDEHPFMIYKNAGVPLIICTDDPGILRTSLTEEYALAAYRYNLSYDEIKQMSRNAIEYSFLPENKKTELLKAFDDKIVVFENEPVAPFEVTIEGDIVVSEVKCSNPIMESGKDNSDKCSKFECDGNNVIVGRTHIGDENGKTTYSYGCPIIVFDDKNLKLAKLFRFNPCVCICESSQSGSFKESDHDFQCGDSECITGRKHSGDENGSTIYEKSKLKIEDTGVFNWTISIKGDPHKIVCCENNNNAEYKLPNSDYYLPMTGREHHGDENGQTTTYFTQYKVTFKLNKK